MIIESTVVEIKEVKVNEMLVIQEVSLYWMEFLKIQVTVTECKHFEIPVC